MRAHAPRSARAARTAAITSAVRRAPRTSWARRTRQPERDAERVGGVRRLAAVVDLGAQQVAEEPLVRRRQEHRPAERGEAVGGPQQLERLRLGLAEVEAGVDHDPLARDAGGLGRLRRASRRKRRDRVDHARRRRARGRARGGRAGCGWRPPTRPAAAATGR